MTLNVPVLLGLGAALIGLAGWYPAHCVRKGLGARSGAAVLLS
jgi:hypothetical protein